MSGCYIQDNEEDNGDGGRLQRAYADRDGERYCSYYIPVVAVLFRNRNQLKEEA